MARSMQKRPAWELAAGPHAWEPECALSAAPQKGRTVDEAHAGENKQSEQPREGRLEKQRQVRRMCVDHLA